MHHFKYLTFRTLKITCLSSASSWHWRGTIHLIKNSTCCSPPFRMWTTHVFVGAAGYISRAFPLLARRGRIWQYGFCPFHFTVDPISVSRAPPGSFEPISPSNLFSAASAYQCLTLARQELTSRLMRPNELNLLSIKCHLLLGFLNFNLELTCNWSMNYCT